MDKLQSSDIRVVLTSTDLDNGRLRYFTNADPAKFVGESGVDRNFVRELVKLDDMMPAGDRLVGAPHRLRAARDGRRLYADGALVGSQPIRPAIRLRCRRPAA